MPGRHRGVLVLEGSVNVHVLVNLEGSCAGTCVPALVTFSHDQLKRRNGTWLSILTLYGSPICSQAMSVSSVLVHVCTCTCVSGYVFSFTNG